MYSKTKITMENRTIKTFDEIPCGQFFRDEEGCAYLKTSSTMAFSFNECQNLVMILGEMVYPQEAFIDLEPQCDAYKELHVQYEPPKEIKE